MRVTGVTKWIEIPHEPGERLQIRMLTWEQLQQASEARTVALTRMVKALAEVRDLLPARDTPAAGAGNADPLAGFDRGTLLASGLVGWSYDDGPANGAELDDVTAEFAARAILTYSRPGATDTKNS